MIYYDNTNGRLTPIVTLLQTKGYKISLVPSLLPEDDTLVTGPSGFTQEMYL